MFALASEMTSRFEQCWADTDNFIEEPQVVPLQAEACQGEEAEPPNSPMVSSPDFQHYPVSRAIAVSGFLLVGDAW